MSLDEDIKKAFSLINKEIHEASHDPEEHEDPEDDYQEPDSEEGDPEEEDPSNPNDEIENEPGDQKSTSADETPDDRSAYIDPLLTGSHLSADEVEAYKKNHRAATGQDVPPPEETDPAMFKQGAEAGLADAAKHGAEDIAAGSPKVYRPDSQHENPDFHIGYHHGYHKGHSGVTPEQYTLPEKTEKNSEYPSISGREFQLLKNLHKGLKEYRNTVDDKNATEEDKTAAKEALEPYFEPLIHQLKRRVIHHTDDQNGIWHALNQASPGKKTQQLEWPADQWHNLLAKSSLDLFGPVRKLRKGQSNKPETVDYSRIPRGIQNAKHTQLLNATKDKSKAVSGEYKEGGEVNTRELRDYELNKKNAEPDIDSDPEVKAVREQLSNIKTPEDFESLLVNNPTHTVDIINRANENDKLKKLMHGMVKNNPAVQKAAKDAVWATLHPETGQVRHGHFITNKLSKGGVIEHPESKAKINVHNNGRQLFDYPEILHKVMTNKFFDSDGTFHPDPKRVKNTALAEKFREHFESAREPNGELRNSGKVREAQEAFENFKKTVPPERLKEFEAATTALDTIKQNYGKRSEDPVKLSAEAAYQNKYADILHHIDKIDEKQTQAANTRSGTINQASRAFLEYVASHPEIEKQPHIKTALLKNAEHHDLRSGAAFDSAPKRKETSAKIKGKRKGEPVQASDAQQVTPQTNIPTADTGKTPEIKAPVAPEVAAQPEVKPAPLPELKTLTKHNPGYEPDVEAAHDFLSQYETPKDAESGGPARLAKWKGHRANMDNYTKKMDKGIEKESQANKAAKDAEVIARIQAAKDAAAKTQGQPGTAIPQPSGAIDHDVRSPDVGHLESSGFEAKLMERAFGKDSEAIKRFLEQMK